jgi:transposase-like protein
MTTPLESQREVILCLLAGKSINRAANETGVPKGTISRLCKKQSFIDLMEQIKAESSSPKSQPKAAAKPVDRPAISVAVEVVGEGETRGRGPFSFNNLSDEKRRELLNLLRSTPVSINVAAAAVGLNPETVLEWIRRGERRDDRRATPGHAKFAREVREAQALCQLRFTAPVVSSALRAAEQRTPDSIEDCKWVLKSRFNDWNPVQKVDVQVETKVMEIVDRMTGDIYQAISAAEIPQQYKEVLYDCIEKQIHGELEEAEVDER